MVLMCGSNLLFTQLFFNQANAAQLRVYGTVPWERREVLLENREKLFRKKAPSALWTSANLYLTVSDRRFSLHFMQSYRRLSNEENVSEAPLLDGKRAFFNRSFQGNSGKCYFFLCTFCENLICRTRLFRLMPPLTRMPTRLNSVVRSDSRQTILES